MSPPPVAHKAAALAPSAVHFHADPACPGHPSLSTSLLGMHTTACLGGLPHPLPHTATRVIDGNARLITVFHLETSCARLSLPAPVLCRTDPSSWACVWVCVLIGLSLDSARSSPPSCHASVSSSPPAPQVLKLCALLTPPPPPGMLIPSRLSSLILQDPACRHCLPGAPPAKLAPPPTPLLLSLGTLLPERPWYLLGWLLWL